MSRSHYPLGFSEPCEGTPRCKKCNSCLRKQKGYKTASWLVTPPGGGDICSAYIDKDEKPWQETIAEQEAMREI